MKNKEKKITKKELGIIQTYFYYLRHYGVRSLEDVYKSCSRAKWESFRDIWFSCKQRGGKQLTVCGHNCMMYSCGYIVERNGKKTLYYHTARNTYKIPVPSYYN